MLEIWLAAFFDYLSKNLLAAIGAAAAVLGVGVVVVLALLQSRARKKRILTKHFKMIWQKSSTLKPKSLLELRPFHKAYHKRDEDDRILEALSAGKNVLIVGSPLSGKTRAVHRALTKLNKPCDVLIARAVDIDIENFLFPRHRKFWRRKVLLIDDLHRFVELQYFEHIFRAADENHTAIVATCRSGFECDKAKAKIGERSLDLDTLFGENVFELGKVSEPEAKKVAKQAGKDWADVKFDGMIGSVFMKLSEMETRFKHCSSEEKTLLRVLRKLYLSGVYEENQVFPMGWVKAVAKTDELEGSAPQWNEWMEELKGKEFITRQKDAVQAEEVYLQDIVKPEVEVSALELFQSVLGALTGLPEALVSLGNRVYGIGEIHLNKAQYLKIAIKAYEQALEVYTLERFPMQYATTQNYLGIAYGTLGEVEAKVENCKLAIGAFKEALKVSALERFPIQYGATQNNLGNAYRTLGEVEARAENCRLAIAAYQEALKVYTLERFPRDYGMTQNNLGNAYGTLGEVEAKAENCRLAIRAYQEALKVYTLEHFPMEYGMAQNNLGTAYVTLGEAQAKVENCKLAIAAFKEALKVYTLELFPMDYGMTQNNLGAAYLTLGEAEAKAENCRLGIAAFKEALKVYTLERFPMQYATTQNNLGNAYGTLGEVEAKVENCRLAIGAYQEALKVRTLERFPMDYGVTQNNLGNAYRTLAEVEDKAGNCARGAQAYKEALGVYTEKDFPQVHQLIMRNLARLLAFCEGKQT